MDESRKHLSGPHRAKEAKIYELRRAVSPFAISSM
jgi:hypothetical protein